MLQNVMRHFQRQSVRSLASIALRETIIYRQRHLTSEEDTTQLWGTSTGVTIMHRWVMADKTALWSTYNKCDWPNFRSSSGIVGQ